MKRRPVLRGGRIARAAPIRRRHPLRGLFKGKIKIGGDIARLDFGEDWDANR
jgi:hypothetical protein